MHLTSLILVLLSSTVPVTALPEPLLFLHQQNPHQVGFPIPPPISPPYGKSLPPSSTSSSSSSHSLRTWEWTHFLTDAKLAVKSLFGQKSYHRGGGHRNGKADYGDNKERNVGRFDNDVVLRVNVSSLSDRIAITQLAEVRDPVTISRVNRFRV